MIFLTGSGRYFINEIFGSVPFTFPVNDTDDTLFRRSPAGPSAITTFGIPFCSSIVQVTPAAPGASKNLAPVRPPPTDSSAISRSVSFSIMASVSSDEYIFTGPYACSLTGILSFSILMLRIFSTFSIMIPHPFPQFCLQSQVAWSISSAFCSISVIRTGALQI